MTIQIQNFQLIVAKPSTWSLRAWLCLKLADISFATQSVSHQTLEDKVAMQAHSETGLVPALNTDDFSLHDSLAIAELANELKPEAMLWPNEQILRARARALVCEMHSGFSEIRTQLPFFLGERKRYQLFSVKNELKRLENIWAQAQGNFYYSQAGIIDAFYAVMAARLYAYQIDLNGKAGDYQQSLLAWPLLQEGLATMETWE